MGNLCTIITAQHAKKLIPYLSTKKKIRTKKKAELLCKKWKLDSIPDSEISTFSKSIDQIVNGIHAARHYKVDEFIKAQDSLFWLKATLNDSRWSEYKIFINKVWKKLNPRKMFLTAYKKSYSTAQGEFLKKRFIKIGKTNVINWHAYIKPMRKAIKYLHYAGLPKKRLDKKLKELRKQIVTYSSLMIYVCYNSAKLLLGRMAKETCTRPIRYLFRCLHALNRHATKPLRKVKVDRLEKLCVLKK